MSYPQFSKNRKRAVSQTDGRCWRISAHLTPELKKSRGRPFSQTENFGRRMRPAASERRGERFAGENPAAAFTSRKALIERDIARNKKRIIQWGMMRQIQKNGRDDES